MGYHTINQLCDDQSILLTSITIFQETIIRYWFVIQTQVFYRVVNLFLKPLCHQPYSPLQNINQIRRYVYAPIRTSILLIHIGSGTIAFIRRLCVSTILEKKRVSQILFLIAPSQSIHHYWLLLFIDYYYSSNMITSLSVIVYIVSVTDERYNEKKGVAISRIDTEDGYQVFHSTIWHLFYLLFLCQLLTSTHIVTQQIKSTTTSYRQ